MRYFILAALLLSTLVLGWPDSAVAQTGDNPEAMQYIRRVTPRYRPAPGPVTALQPPTNPYTDPNRIIEESRRRQQYVPYPSFGYGGFPVYPIYPPIHRPPHHRPHPRPESTRNLPANPFEMGNPGFASPRTSLPRPFGTPPQ
jgi:hypothetical protein